MQTPCFHVLHGLFPCACSSDFIWAPDTCRAAQLLGPHHLAWARGKESSFFLFAITVGVSWAVLQCKSLCWALVISRSWDLN